MAARLGGEFKGRVDACICVAESLGCLPGTITALFVNQLYSIEFKIILKKERKSLSDL